MAKPYTMHYKFSEKGPDIAMPYDPDNDDDRRKGNLLMDMQDDNQIHDVCMEHNAGCLTSVILLITFIILLML